MISQISQEDYRRVKEILADALEVAPAERTAFIKKACDGNELLLAEVESLLGDESSDDKFLEDFSAFSVLKDSISDSDKFIGQKIGSYQLERELGRGGMGVVFLAVREDFHQQAAIKLIKRGMDSDAILERFQREREILAALNHPYIARLLDGGTTADNLPYFVMEYVEGLPIDEYCQTNNLSEKEILELFRKVCEAVSFAHQKLIVHRDLKPSNILVTADGTPKLLDFGIAKLLTSDESQNTQTNQRALTPAYASPEQISGEQVDTTSDVYSLGKILAELLHVSGTKLISDTTDGGKSRTTNTPTSTLPIDLQAILQTALRTERTRRYNSVERFSDDIRRYQIGLPISARKDTFAYRAKKFAQRNLVAVTLATLFVLSLIVGLTAEVWQAREIRRERETAQRRFNDVRALAGSVLFNLHDAVEKLPGSTPARKIIVEQALEYLNKLDQESAGDASLQRELASAYAKVGQIQGNSYNSNLGDTDGAMKSYQRSLELRQKLTAADPNNIDLQKELSDSYEGIGDMLYTSSDLRGGLQNYQNALAIREKLAADASDNLDYQAALASIYGKIGDIEGMDGYPNLGDTKASLEYYQKALAVDKRLIELAPETATFKINYAQRSAGLGILYRVVGKTAYSIKSCQQADEIYQPLIAANPNDVENRISLLANNIILRYSLADEMRDEDAAALMNQTIKILEEMQTVDPKNLLVRRSLGVSYNALSQTLTQKGDYDRAIEYSQKALKIAEDSANKNSSSTENSEDLASTLRFLANAEFQKKDYTNAMMNYRRAIDIHQKNLAADPSNARTQENLSNCIAGMGEVEAAKGNFDAAIKDFSEVIPATEESSQKSPLNAVLHSRLALRYSELGKVYESAAKAHGTPADEKSADAVNYFGKSIAIWSQMQHEGILNKIDTGRYQTLIARNK